MIEDTYEGWTLHWICKRSVGYYENNPPMYERFIEKIKYLRTKGMLENILIYLY